MASAKRTPKVSRISRDRTVAYVRKQKPTPGGGEADGDADPPDQAPDQAAGPADQVAAEQDAGTALASPVPEAATPASPVPEARAPGAPAVPDAAADAAAPTPVASPNPHVEPWPDATPLPMKPVDPGRVRVSTVTIPALTSLGEPPAMPPGAAPVSTGGSGGGVDVASAEDPTRMPGPREIPGGTPDDPAPPPGYVPPGDSRSMRRRTDQDEFALIYRIQTYVISRFGKVGRRGQWRVVEYPTSASAGHAYAKECSRFVSEGFSDYRA